MSSSKNIAEITSFISKKVIESRSKGVVMGLSGGVDSAVTAALCVRALGSKRVLGVFMFEQRAKNSQDFIDAQQISAKLRIKTLDIPISGIVKGVSSVLRSRKCATSRLTLANIKARIRMLILYAIANEKSLLVAGTGDRSEGMVGYFTKFGDGGVDLLPIGHLYKTEVKALGIALRLPYGIITKPSSPNLWPGQKASQELPADYDLLDKILTLKFDSRKKPTQIRKETGAAERIITDIINLNKSSAHKRRLPSMVRSIDDL